MYQPVLKPDNSIAAQHIAQLSNYYQNMVQLAPNLYTMQFQIIPERPDMLQLQIQIPSNYPNAPPRLSAKGFKAPPFIDPTTTLVRNIKSLSQWVPGRYSLLSTVGQLHHFLINYAKQPQAFDLSYQVTQGAPQQYQPQHQKPIPLQPQQYHPQPPHPQHPHPPQHSMSFEQNKRQKVLAKIGVQPPKHQPSGLDAVVGGFMDIKDNQENKIDIREKELEKPDIDKIMEEFSQKNTKQLQSILQDQPTFDAELSQTTQMLKMTDRAEAIRRQAYNLAKQNLKVREEYLLKDNVAGLIQEYEVLKQKHSQLKKNFSENTKLKDAVIAKLQTDYHILTERYRSLDSEFEKSGSIKYADMKKEYLECAKKSKMIGMLLDDFKNILDDQDSYQGSAISRSKSQLAQFGIATSIRSYMMKNDQQLRKTYVWKLLDFLLFKTEQIYMQQKQTSPSQQRGQQTKQKQSNQKALSKIENNNIKTNNPIGQQYKFNQNTNQLLSGNQTIKQIVEKQKSMAIKQFNTDLGQIGKGLYTINLGDVQSNKKNQQYFDSDKKSKNFLLHDQVLWQKKANDYEILLVGRKIHQNSSSLHSSNLDNSLIKNQIFQQNQLSQQVIAGSKFYQGVKQNQGVVSYYIRKIHNIILLVIVFSLGCLWYGASKSIWKRNEDVLKMELFYAVSRGNYNVSGFYQRTVKFFSQIISTKN